MAKRRSTGGSSSRPFFIGMAACVVVALGLVVGFELLTRDGGGQEAAVTNAPTDHPSPAASGGPDLHFSTTSIDLGLVPLGKEVGYTFSFANIGAKPLRIGDVNVRAVEGC